MVDKEWCGQLHEDLEYSQASHSMISADCEELEIQLHKQGHTARKRLNELSRERDQLQQTLQERNAETRAACEATLEAANSSLACQTEEAVRGSAVSLTQTPIMSPESYPQHSTAFQPQMIRSPSSGSQCTSYTHTTQIDPWCSSVVPDPT